MLDRKKKLILIQFGLLVLGIMAILITYSGNDNTQKEDVISLKSKEKIENPEGNAFYNIEYSGIDLAGNRYIIKSKKAIPKELNENFIQMEGVTSFFYFKDGTVLKINSDFGEYNNNTLDIEFKKNIKAEYEKSTIEAQSAKYSNSVGYLTVSENVKINDIQGNLLADKLVFDVKKQTLKIETFNNNRINVNVDTDEKRF